jgi:hypothetical protein
MRESRSTGSGRCSKICRAQNGTWLRGDPVTGPVPLGDGDEIRIRLVGSRDLQSRV